MAALRPAALSQPVVHLGALPTPPVPPTRPVMHPVIRRVGAFRPLGLPLRPTGPTLQPAPVPDPDRIAPPRVRLPVELAPTLYWPRSDVTGDGYPAGSQHLTQIELPGAAAPGVRITVPLD